MPSETPPTRAEVMALDGRGLDAAVAEHLMGYERRCNRKDAGLYMLMRPSHEWYGTTVAAAPDAAPYYDVTRFVPDYSTDRNACQDVLREIGLRDIGVVFSVHLWMINGFDDKHNVWASHCFRSMLAPPSAICRAALLAATEAK